MPNLKVIVPLDGSRLAEQSLVYLDALRSLSEIEVLLISVVDAKEAFSLPNPADAVDKETNLLGVYLREVARDLEQHLGLRAETRVPTGSPAERILGEAAEFGADLILISTHGRSGLSRWRFGSVADKVIRGAACNVLVIGPEASLDKPWLDVRLQTPFMKLLVPLDGSELAETALPMVAALAEAYNSVIHLVQAVQLPIYYDAFSTRRSTAPDLLDNVREVAYSYLARVAVGLGRPDAVTRVLVGPTADQLHEYVEQHQIDLVVMSSRGRSGVLRTILGSVTDRMLGGQAPVLVVKA